MNQDEKNILATIVDAGIKSLGLTIFTQIPNGLTLLDSAMKKLAALEETKEAPNGNDNTDS